MSVPETASELLQYLAALQKLKSKPPNYNKVIPPLQDILNDFLKGSKRAKSAASRVKLAWFGWDRKHGKKLYRIKRATAECNKSSPC